MAKNAKKIPADIQLWIDAGRQHKLSHAHIQMARELGLNPKSLGKLDNHHQEPWKLPLPDFITDLYRKRTGDERPAVVRTMEEVAAARMAKNDARKRRRRSEAAGTTHPPPPPLPSEDPVQQRTPNERRGRRSMRASHAVLALLVAMFAASRSLAAEPARHEYDYGPNLEAFAYPYPVKRYDFTSQGVAMSMAYLDVAPAKPNGRTAVLLHGKNFCAVTWQGTIDALVGAGFRVIAPDQIGFCKSTKPDGYQFSFHQLAVNTHALLVSLGIDRATIIGHSTGGMLAVRYALTFPQATEKLVLVDPIGLEDWKAEGVPARTVDEWTERERQTTTQSMRAYQQATYYAGNWKPDYDRWVEMYAGMFRGRSRDLVARVTARIDDMIFQQPVVYEFGSVRVPTLLIIGDKDNTAIGKDLAPPDVRAKIGNYHALGAAAAKAIPGAKLIEFSDLGHAPQIQDPGRFHKALLEWLAPR